jgi:hypothetical protein
VTGDLEWHRTIVDQLERRVQNRDFYIWLHAGRRRGKNIDYDALGREVETWLRSLDPDSHVPLHPGLRPYGPTLDLEIRAIPKLPEARGSQPLVANPYPAVPYWEEHQPLRLVPSPPPD